MAKLDDSLTQIRNAWLAGRSAKAYEPADWQEVVGDDELALLALVGHATGVLSVPASSAALVHRPLLPNLAIPLIPEGLRTRFRRLLAGPKNAPSLEHQLIRFLAARGFAAHPADWLPDAKDDWAPDLYAPWLDWVRAETSAPDRDQNDTLTPETYQDWSWTERRRELERLRRQGPDAALAVIAANAAIEPAERRLRLIELLGVNLSSNDVGFLESLAKDRSDRVQALARAFLARLGHNTDTEALTSELAAMTEVTHTGVFSRRARLKLPALKTAAQVARRRDLMKLTGFGALARALNTTELALVESPPDCPRDDLPSLFNFIAETGSDTTVRALINVLLADDQTPLAYLPPLITRLNDAERRDILPLILRQDGHLFELTLAIAESTLGFAPLAMLASAPSFATLQANIHAETGSDDSARRIAGAQLDHLLPRVGLLLDCDGSRALLAKLTGWGFSPADPRLDMLYLNAALTPETAK